MLVLLSATGLMCTYFPLFTFPAVMFVDCGNNVSIINGQALFPDGNTTYGHSVPVLCDTGFKLRSELFITCQADGTWSAAPDCDIIGKVTA